jgi:putative nucleotidyltransferase with HDIG domain
MHIPEELRRLTTGEAVYIVGGTVRDLLMGRRPQDYDLVVPTRPETVADVLARRIGGHCVPLGKPGMRVHRIVGPRYVVDVARVNGQSIHEDLAQRDFTINAMAAALPDGRIVDLCGGRRDLAGGIVRLNHPLAFRRDPVRLLRAYRMAAELDFRLSEETVAAVAADARHIQRCAGERAHHELMRIWAAPRSQHLIFQMADSGLLSAVFPELESLKGCRAPRFHAVDAWTHTLRAYAMLEDLLLDGSLIATAAGAAGDTAAAAVHPELLRCAMILHDIGKPVARSVDHTRRVRYPAHEIEGARMARHRLEQLRFSTREIDTVARVIHRHMRPLSLFQAKAGGTLTNKGVCRLFCDFGAETPAMLLFALADHLGKSDRPDRREGHFAQFIAELMGRYRNRFAPNLKRPPLITGHDLIERFGISPGPLVGELLSVVEEERLCGRLHTHRDALDRVGRLLADRRQKTTTP